MLSTLQKNPDNESVKSPIVDQIFYFVKNSDHLALALQWEEKGYVFNPKDQPETNLFNLTKSHKHSILRIVYRSKEIILSEKENLLGKIIGDDKSDLALNTQLTCEASLPDPLIKEKIWQELINPQSKLSLYQKRAKMGGFYDFDQIDIC